MFELILAAEAAASEGTNFAPFITGGVALGILLILLFGVIQFGRGREHS